MSSDNTTPSGHAPVPPHDPASAEEARVLAVLLGDASPFEAEAVAELLAARPDLRAYRDRTAALLGLLPDAVKPEAGAPALRLDDARRAALLAKLAEHAGANASASASDTVSEIPVRGRILRFFRSTIPYAPRYAAALAVVLVIGLAVSSLLPLGKVRSHRAESPASPSEEFATGAGGGVEGEKAMEFKSKALREEEGAGFVGDFRRQKASRDRIVSKSENADIVLSGDAGVSWKAEREEVSVQTFGGRANVAAAPSAPSAPPTPVVEEPAPAPTAGPFGGGGVGASFNAKGKVDFDSEYVFRGKEHSDENIQTKVTGDYAAGSDSLPSSPTTSIASFAPGLRAGGLSQGSGGGSGGGEGSGVAIGQGGGRNFVSTFGETKQDSSRRDLDGAAGVDKDSGASTPFESNTYADITKRASGTLTLETGEALRGSAGGSGGGQAPGDGIAQNGAFDGSQLARGETQPAAEKVPTLDNLPLTGRLQAGKKSAEGWTAADESSKSLAGYDQSVAGAKETKPAKPSLAKDTTLADAPLPQVQKKPAARPVEQTETLAAVNNFSTFSLNVSDVSFRLAAEAVKRGAYPDIQNIRTEEFVNAQAYRDPAPLPGEAVALRQEQARHPFAHNRSLLRLSLKTASEGRSAQSPLNLVVLLDNSGSMERADRRETVSAANTVLADNLRPGDKVSVVGFARSQQLLVDRMDGANTKPLRDLAKNAPPSEGGTNLEAALATAYAKLASQTPAGASGRVVLLTDGAANLGDADPARLAAIVASNARQGRALDAFGVGFDGYNDTLLEQLSRKGDGRYAYMNNVDEARDEFGRKLAGALRPFANDVKVQVEFNPARVNAWRLAGYDNHRLRKQDFRDNKVDAAEIAANESGTALYSLELKPDGVGDIGVVRVRYREPGSQNYREREWPILADTTPAFTDAPEGLRLAACSAFVAEALTENPNAATTDRAQLRKEISRLSAERPGDPRISTLRALADKLAR